MKLADLIANYWIEWPDGIREAVIGAGATVVAAVLAALVVFCQIGHQARQAIEQNRRNEAIKLKLQIYEQIVETCDHATKAGLELHLYIQKFQMQLNSVRILRDLGAHWEPPESRFLEVSEIHSTTQKAAISIIGIVERWRIIDPRMSIFQTAVNVALHDVKSSFSDDFVGVAIQTMPMEDPASVHLLPWDLPAELLLTELERSGKRVIDAVDILGSYIDDFQREMQNMLVGEVFPHHRVPPREPMDPKFIVVTLDRHKELGRQFENETAWGRAKTASETQVQKALAARDAREGES